MSTFRAGLLHLLWGTIRSMDWLGYDFVSALAGFISLLMRHIEFTSSFEMNSRIWYLASGMDETVSFLMLFQSVSQSMYKAEGSSRFANNKTVLRWRSKHIRA